MRTFGLIGYPLEHSFSETFFQKKFVDEGITNCVYKLFPLQCIEEFPVLLKKTFIKGLNVTIPYKKSIIPYLHRLDAEAKAVGAVNCIAMEGPVETMQLVGYNTDVFGFETLLQAVKSALPKKALILGSGGGSLAVAHVFRKLAVEFMLVSRKPADENAIHYSELTQEHLAAHQMIVNTTPLGLFPDSKTFPDIPYRFITPQHVCVDLIYNPAKTAFLAKAEMFGAETLSGLLMLYAQAARSWEIWNK
ncbi:MAG: shikimate dehydrogenase [Bacteroidota bacterium]